MSRIGWIIGGFAVVAIGASVFLATRSEPASPDVAAARTACEHADRFADLVARDASTDAARRSLTSAIASARAAVAIDASWAPLQSGLETLEIALEKDDEGAANVGLRVVHANCERARDAS